MTEPDLEIRKLDMMANDTSAAPLFERGAPLAWFNLMTTCAATARKGTLSDKQRALINDVYRQYQILGAASQRFLQTDACRRIGRTLQQVQKSKPAVASPLDKSRSQRFSEVVRALFGDRIMHIGRFDEAERLLGEMQVANVTALWEELHLARRAYLSEWYRSAGA